MDTQVTIQISQTLYRRAQRLAQSRHQALADVLADGLRRSEAALAGATPEEAAMEREEEAYQAMHAELLADHIGQYVAIHQGQLIDHDPSELALLLRHRVNTNYPERDRIDATGVPAARTRPLSSVATICRGERMAVDHIRLRHRV